MGGWICNCTVAAQHEADVKQVSSWTYSEMQWILGLAEKHEQAWHSPLLGSSTTERTEVR